MKWVAGWNMPGYLPDTVEEFDSFADAREFIIDELTNLIDFEEDSDLRRELKAARREVRSIRDAQPFEVYASDYAYFVDHAVD